MPLAAASPVPVEEGIVHAFANADEIAWAPDTGSYILVVRAGPAGATVDVSNMSMAHEPEQTKHLDPHRGFGSSVEFQGGEAQSMRVLDGSGDVVLARADLARHEVGNIPAPFQELDGVLAPSSCQAYLYQAIAMQEPFQVVGQGAGITFRFYDALLNPIGEGRDRLEARLNPDTFEQSELILQACLAAEQQAGAFRLEITYPAPPSTSTKHLGNPVWTWMGAAAAIAFVLVLILRGRRRFGA